MDVRSVIRYLRECYREDTVRGGYWDLHASKVEHRIVFAGAEQLVDEVADTLVIPPGCDARRVFRDVTLKRGEREFLYGSLFVVGRLRSATDGRARKLCSPLVLFPLRIEGDEDSVVLRADLAGRRLNSALLDALADSRGVPNFTDEIAAEVDSAGLAPGSVLRIEAALRDRLPGFDVSAMAAWPQRLDREELAAARARAGNPSADGPLRLLPASAAALWPKSDAVRGIVSELAAVADAGKHSVPLSLLLGFGAPEADRDEAPGRGKIDVAHVPAVLSASQQGILRSARRNPLTIAHGPPGTGKSFTIAAVALDHMARGESVLVASKMDRAVDVVGDKIEDTFGVRDCLVRAGRASYLADLKRDLDSLLAGRSVAAEVLGDNRQRKRAYLELVDRIASRERMIARAGESELRIGRRLAAEGGGWVARLGRWWTSRRALRRPLPHEAIEALESDLDLKIDLAREVLRQMRAAEVQRCLECSRPQLQRFNKALRSRRAVRKEQLFEDTDFESILDAFPIWLVKLADIHRVLPLRDGLFDLAIIDEATQCDVPSCLPILQRARRVMIAGDARQLRHISFLSRARQSRLAQDFGIDERAAFADYRGVSLLDLTAERIADQSRVGFLNEHYRSLPPIIAFSNERFYSGALNIMTQRPGAPDPDCLHLHACAGERDAAGVNAAEIDAVIDRLTALLDAEGQLAAQECRSVGVLSPFRAQVDALREAIASRFDAARFARLSGAHELLVATAHGFQGEERDVMLLSLAAGGEGAGAALRFLARPDVLNVAITRARVEQHILCSFDPDSLPGDSLLGAYLRHMRGESRGAAEGAAASGLLHADRFAREVLVELEGRGCRVLVGHRLAGLRFDLIALGERRSLAIDLIGHPGLFESAFPLERYKMFRRAGMRIFPLAYSAWRLRREQCLEALDRALAGRR